jgi:ribose transport system permease protein
VSDIREVPAAEEEADRPEQEGMRGRLRRRLTETTTWTFLILLTIVAAFAILRFQQFATVFNFRNIAADASGLLIIAVGMTFVIITSGIDLSVGSVLVFSGVIAAKVMLALGGEGWGAIGPGLVAGVAAGVAWGVVNGVLVTKARVPPLIVTLGTLGMAYGAALLITGGIDVRGVPLELTTTIGIGQLRGVPYVVIIAAVVTAVGAVTLSMTRCSWRAWPAWCRWPASRPPPSAGTPPTTWPRSPRSCWAAPACSAGSGRCSARWWACSSRPCCRTAS